MTEKPQSATDAIEDLDLEPEDAGEVTGGLKAGASEVKAGKVEETFDD
jgi:hypothetical protein